MNALARASGPLEQAQHSDSNKNLFWGRRWGSTPRQTGRMTVSHIIDLFMLRKLEDSWGPGCC
jgi:hypothetical protein